MSSSTENHSYTNRLINETSPYLLQHAHNPVDWYPWGDEALEKAKRENKPLIISIGYSACHWCHVMERESFEDEEVAKFMNENFVCIKVDREERPDVDQIYMDAVQLITGRGGWPLNAFALPDGRPFYAGTYFPKKNWLYLMNNIINQYHKDPEKVNKHAEEVTAGIIQNEMIKPSDKEKKYHQILNAGADKWIESFDKEDGGNKRVPKFPLPNNFDFLLSYGFLEKNQEILDQVELTLNKMAMGGIYDQAGGGFARYSTDAIWKVPHFEKMLYDNSQLMELYSKAYRHFKSPLYKRVIEQTAEFIEREMTGKKGEFYSALDADSEGEEGKFYIWTEEELQNIDDLDFEFVSELYDIKKGKEWEHSRFILHRDQTDKEIIKKLKLDGVSELESKIQMSNELILNERSERIRPGLDDKTLTSWNAMMISGYVEVYKTLGNKKYLQRAERNAEFIWNEQHRGKGQLNHSYKNGISSIDGFLEDYAFTIKAFLDLFEVSMNEQWIERADLICQYTIDHFKHESNDMYYFTSDANKLIARKMEIHDNVIPSSNSVMALALFRLGLLTDNEIYIENSRKMLDNVIEDFAYYGSGFSNWAILALNNQYPFYEIAINGKNSQDQLTELTKEFIPNSIFIASQKESSLPLLEGKFVSGETYIYVCQNKTCQLPVQNWKEAVKQLTYN